MVIGVGAPGSVMVTVVTEGVVIVLSTVYVTVCIGVALIPAKYPATTPIINTTTTMAIQALVARAFLPNS